MALHKSHLDPAGNKSTSDGLSVANTKAGLVEMTEVMSYLERANGGVERCARIAKSPCLGFHSDEGRSRAIIRPSNLTYFVVMNFYVSGEMAEESSNRR